MERRAQRRCASGSAGQQLIVPVDKNVGSLSWNWQIFIDRENILFFVYKKCPVLHYLPWKFSLGVNTTCLLLTTCPLVDHIGAWLSATTEVIRVYILILKMYLYIVKGMQKVLFFFCDTAHAKRIIVRKRHGALGSNPFLAVIQI